MESSINSAKSFFLDLAIRIVILFCSSMILLIAVSFLMYGLVLGVEKIGGVELGISYILIGGIVLGSTLFVLKFILTKKRKSSFQDKKISEVESVRLWTQEHPFQAIGAAGVFGFMMAGNATDTPTTLLVLFTDFLKQVVQEKKNQTQQNNPPKKEETDQAGKERMETEGNTHSKTPWQQANSKGT